MPDTISRSRQLVAATDRRFWVEMPGFWCTSQTPSTAGTQAGVPAPLSGSLPLPFLGSPLPCPLPQLPSHAPSPSHPPQDPVCPAGSVPFPFWGSGTSQITQVPVLILICWELASVMGACKSSSGTGSPRLPPHWSPLAVSSPGCIVISCDEAFQKTK